MNFALRSTTVFSHSQSVVVCSSCSAVLCTPTGGKARLTEGALPMPTLAITKQGAGRDLWVHC